MTKSNELFEMQFICMDNLVFSHLFQCKTKQIIVTDQAAQFAKNISISF